MFYAVIGAAAVDRTRRQVRYGLGRNCFFSSKFIFGFRRVTPHSGMPVAQLSSRRTVHHTAVIYTVHLVCVTMDAGSRAKPYHFTGPSPRLPLFVSNLYARTPDAYFGFRARFASFLLRAQQPNVHGRRFWRERAGRSEITIVTKPDAVPERFFFFRSDRYVRSSKSACLRFTEVIQQVIFSA